MRYVVCNGVFYLFADRDLVTVLYKSGNITVNAVIRYSAHRGTLVKPAILARQNYIKFFACNDGVVKKHFIEISETVHQDIILVLFLHLNILLHHRRQLRCFRHLFFSP